ncbi:hypothetical protein LCGC14_2134460 [marine sediment metagenome]|uniref:Uncharacterized protein n=1 Tax=marine sediment metagenome TaxID=412755 RepID=A0A0F9GWK3_9ZZZZ
MKIKKILLVAGAASLSLPSALAAVAIDADTLEGLPYIGSDVGSFLKNLAPGIGAFIIILGVFGGVAAIIYAIVGVVKNRLTV